VNEGRGRRLLENFLNSKGWGIFNGTIKGNDEGEFTFTGGKEDLVIA